MGTAAPSESAPGTPGADTPAFGHAVGFLLSQLGFAVAGRFRQGLAAYELEPRHFALMRAVEASDGQAQHVLAASLRIPTSSMVSLIDDLEEHGLVERRLHATDRRTRTLHLTRRGVAKLASASTVAAALEDEVCTGLTGDEREALIAALERVAGNLGLVQGVHPNLDGVPRRDGCADEA